MCIDCGCSAGESKIVGHSHSHDHHHENRLSPAHAHAPNINPARMVKIEQDILGKNNQYAAGNRDYFRSHGIFTLNLVSSPGSGKTTLLTKTI